MLTDLLDSARALRNPLIVGYSALTAFWLVSGEEVNRAALGDALGRRILAELDLLGAAANLALLTFAAAMIGSLLWNGGVSRLVRYLSVRAGHPDWASMVEDAKKVVQRYETYDVTTYKGQSGSKPSSFDKSHSVPSLHYANYLHERVDERERKAAEMSFRVTLAVALTPIAVAIGIEGGGRWWWSLCAIPFVWLDVALMKHTAVRTVRRYQLEDLQAKLDRAERRLTSVTGADPQPDGSAEQSAQAEARLKEIAELQEEVNAHKTDIAKLQVDEARWVSKLFAVVLGQSAE